MHCQASLARTQGIGQQAKLLVHHRCPSQGRRVTTCVEGWRNLHHVRSNQIQPAQPAQQLQGLPRREPTALGRAGARCVHWVQGIDV
jgi:hypothetical protein|eukprot:COSAG01_NODE_315_length_19007_cov_18.180135_5_plen_87_part_00